MDIHEIFKYTINLEHLYICGTLHEPMNNEHYENIMHMFPDHLCTIYAHDLEHYLKDYLKYLTIL